MHLKALLPIAFSLSLSGAQLCCSVSASESGKSGTALAVRQRLNPGYSLLYQEAQGLHKARWLLMFKDKTPALANLVGDTLGYYGDLANTLEDLPKAHRGMRIDLNPMPEIEGRAREAQGEAQFGKLRPIVGEAGLPFERDLLLLLRDALGEQKYLVAEMRKDEPDAALQTFLDETHRRLDALYERSDQLLQQRYFVHEQSEKP